MATLELGKPQHSTTQELCWREEHLEASPAATENLPTEEFDRVGDLVAMACKKGLWERDRERERTKKREIEDNIMERQRRWRQRSNEMLSIEQLLRNVSFLNIPCQLL